MRYYQYSGALGWSFAFVVCAVTKTPMSSLTGFFGIISAALILSIVVEKISPKDNNGYY